MLPGAVFKQSMHITPGGDASYIVQIGSIGGSQYGFTNLSDLLNWLVANAQAIAAEKVAEQVTQMTEADIVKPSLLSRIGLAEAPSMVRPGVLRTTAAEVIAEREGRSGISAAEMAKANNRDPAA